MNDSINQTQIASTKSGLKKAIVTSLMLILMIIIAGFTYGYVELAKVNMKLANNVNALQQQANETTTTLAELKQNITTLQTALQKSQALADEQQQLVNDWHKAETGDLSKWHVAEAAYLVKLANQHLAVTHDPALTITTLQSAANLLADINDNKLTIIKQTLDTDIKNLQNLTLIDEQSIYNKLTNLDVTLQTLPLPSMPLSPLNAATTTIDANSSWWQRGLAESWAALSKVVVVRRNKTGALPLVLPEEKTYLYLNLHMETQSAIWGLLQRDNVIYQTSLTRIISWINTYFVPDAPETKAVLATLVDLQKVDITPPDIHFNDLLPLFDAYLTAKS